MSKYYIETTKDKQILNLLCNGDLKYKKGRYEGLEYYEYEEMGKAIADFMKLCVNGNVLHCQLHTNEDLIVDKDDTPDFYDLSNYQTRKQINDLRNSLEYIQKENELMKEFIEQHNAYERFRKWNEDKEAV